VSETDVVRAAMKFLAAKFPGSFFWRANSGGNKSGRKHNSRNLVDIVGWQRSGMAMAIEVKTEDGRLARLQYVFLAEVNKRGGYAGLFTPSGLFDFGSIPDKHMPRGRK
jgi:hypothetical protein